MTEPTPSAPSGGFPMPWVIPPKDRPKPEKG